MRKTFTQVWLVAIILSSTAELNAQTANENDSLALVDLYNSTGGPNWANNSGWINGPVSNWFGILLDGDGRVTSITLKHSEGNGNNLHGFLPSSLGSLSNLQTLNLSQNYLYGSLPLSLGNLSNLVTLDLSTNNLSGEIPSSLGNLTKLQLLSLGGNNITGSIPVSFGNLVNLTTLNLACNITGPIPSFLGNLTKLQTLKLYGDLRDSIPAFLGNLSNLRVLAMGGSQLSGSIPPELGNLTMLEQLELGGNILSGPVPLTLDNFFNLQYLNLSNNHFTFSGLEEIAQNYPFADYSYQYRIPAHVTGSTVWVSAGGALANNTYQWYNGKTPVSINAGDSTYNPIVPGKYTATVTNAIATGLALFSDTATINGDSVILQTQPNAEFASYEYTDNFGWTNYYYNNNTPYDLTDDVLLLSLKKNGQNIGSRGDGTFSLRVVATSGAGSNTGVLLSNPLITNTSGYWVMNRYWRVIPTQEPTKDVGVRVYYNNQDLKDVNGSYPSHNLSNNNLIFYKTIGGDPDPTTNLQGATKIISILPGIQPTDTTWTYHAISDTTQYAEYRVASFSGGGGGGTGNNLALPVTLTNFNGQPTHEGNLLQWQTVTEINSAYFNLQRSTDGLHFNNIANILAAGNSNSPNSYNYSDVLAGLNPVPKVLYYRLQIADKNGAITYSKIMSIKNDGLSPQQLKIYPNPAHDILTAELGGMAGVADVTITDAAGKTIDKQHLILGNGQTVKINIHKLAPGIYFVYVYQNKQNFKQKFVKQ